MFRDLDHVHTVVALEMDFSKIILIQEVVRHHETLVIVCESDVVGTCVHSKIHDARLHRMFGIRYIEHAYLASLERSKDQTVARSRHGQQLSHASANIHLDMRNDVFAVEHHLGRAIESVHQINKPVKHPRGERPALWIARYQFYIHGAWSSGNFNSPKYPPLL